LPVKNKKRGRPKGSNNKLASSTIVDCAKQLMRTERKVPSIRNIAAALDFDAMAIYHYFPRKSALLEAVMVSLVAEIYEPLGEDTWQVELERLCKSYLRLLTDHTGLLETILTTSSEGPATVFTQRFHIALAPLNLDKKKLEDARDLLADYLHGFAFAMNCNPKDKNLRIDLIDGPLALYITALASEVSY
jgi:AcrR family transcriptional regulator